MIYFDMDEFGAKKLGEVLAFSRAGYDIFTKGKSALVSVFGDKYDEILSEFEHQESLIIAFAKDHGISSITFSKSRKTTKKLLNMAEMYIGDEWDNPAELMEWLGFFEGAAVIHWRLVLGKAKSAEDKLLERTSMSALKYHKNLLDIVGEKIEEYARNK